MIPNSTNKMNFHIHNNPKRHAYDFYPTPPAFTKVLLDNIDFRGEVLEPCCGEGHMSEVSRVQLFGPVVSSDIMPYNGYGSVKDIFDYTHAVNLVTNPPYSQALDMAYHALKITNDKVALLVRLIFLEGCERKKLFDWFPPWKVLVISNRMRFVDTGKSSQFAHCWVIWKNVQLHRDNQVGHSDTIVDWVLAE